MSVNREFATVDLILNSDATTRGVDAWALSMIKVERQLRRLMTFLVFQSPALGYADVRSLRKALSDNRNVYIEGFIRGFDALYSKTLAQLVGSRYGELEERLNESTRHRRKIFHGQLTDRYLSRHDLVGLAGDLRVWSTLVADSSMAEFGYDGFDRNSFRKSTNAVFPGCLRRRFAAVEEYGAFIRTHVQRN